MVKATSAGSASVDGFISDTANYTPVTEPFLPNSTLSVGGQPVDSAKFYQWNPFFDEHSYDNAMYTQLVSSGFPSSIGFLIDTSRNGWGGPNRPTQLNSTPTTPDSYVAANKIASGRSGETGATRRARASVHVRRPSRSAAPTT